MQYLTFCDPHNAADAVGRSGELRGNQSVSGEEPAPPRRVDGVEFMIELWAEKRCDNLISTQAERRYRRATS